jgi:quercetin dioxygenase-like cupin family protein
LTLRGFCSINTPSERTEPPPTTKEYRTMAIPHASSGQVIDVRPLGDRLTGEVTTALFKSEQLEVIRLVLPAGKAFPPHRVAGEITIHCIEGLIDVSEEGQSRRLAAGQMLFLSPGVLHGVVAVEDASALVTIVLCQQGIKA